MSRIDKSIPPVDAQSAENDDHTNIHIHTQNSPAIDKSRSCMGVVAAIVPPAAVNKEGVSPSIIN